MDISIYSGIRVPNNDSPMARIGNKLIRVHQILLMARPLITLAIAVVFIALWTVDPVLAQSVLQDDASKPVRAIRRFADYAIWGTLGAGIFGACWAGFNKISGKPWGGQMLGSAFCLGISGLIAFINSVVQGEGPEVMDW